jgi:hypothetical protein
VADYDWGQGLKGAGGGALAGAAFGGPVGAAIGGGVGLLSGFFGNKENQDEQNARKMLMDYYRSVQGRGGVQLGATQQGQTSGDIRNRQLSLADQLAAISRGEGPSLAEQQLRSATDRNQAQQLSFANSGRGGPMAASRAMNNSARLGAIAGQDAASARIAEANQARQLLGLNLHGMRGADEEMSRFNAQQGNEMSQAQMWAQLKSRGMDDQTIMQIIGGLQGQNQSVAGRPGLGDSVLAGGAGLYSMGMSQKAASKAAQNA